MRIESVKRTLLALGVGSVITLSGCASMAVGGGKNPVGGSAGGAHSANANKTLEHCDRPLGTLAVEEHTSEPWYGILTNQTSAPKGISDIDVYSHFSFVRTLHYMFQVADPAVEGSYMNRSKYTEHFIAANILNLPEYASSADTHFDSVRPINHAWVAPATYVQKQSSDVSRTAQIGPDANNSNVWAVK